MPLAFEAVAATHDAREFVVTEVGAGAFGVGDGGVVGAAGCGLGYGLWRWVVGGWGGGGVWAWVALWAVVVALWAWSVRNRVRSESVLVLRDLGIQLQTTFVWGNASFLFVEKERILEILINEGVTCHAVVFYLAVVVKDAPDLLLVFPRLQPRLPTLRTVYNHLRQVVFNEDAS